MPSLHILLDKIQKVTQIYVVVCKRSYNIIIALN